MKYITQKAILSSFFVCILATAAGRSAFAGNVSRSVDLGTVTVTGEEMSTGIRGDGSIGKGEIEKPRSSRTVDGLLTEVAGIDVKRTSPTGNSGSEVLMRGVDESRYLVLLDGRPLNGSGVFGGHYVDWSSLSTEDIERVEIIRGAASAEYGNTLGGTINIVTGKGTEKNRVRARSSYGSFNTVNAAVSHSGNLGNIIYDDLSYGYWRSDGYLRNNFAERHSLSGTMDLVLPDDLIVGLGIRYTRQKRGFVVENRKEKDNYDSDHPESDEDIGAGPRIHWYGKPGPFGPVDHSKYWGDGSYWLNKRGQYDVDVRKSFDAFDIRARGFMNRQERTEYYYAVDDESRLVLERYTEPERSGGWSVKVSMPAGRHDVVYGAEGVYLGYGKQEIKSADSSYFRIQPSSYDPPEKASRRHGLFAQGSWRITDALKLGAGLRYDNYWAKPSDIIYEQGLSPKARIRYTISEGFDVEASFGRSYRFPTSPESYWYLAGYDPPGRGDLSPERAIQAEAGVNREFRKGALNLRGYYYDVRDYIRTIFGYRPSRVVYNIDKVILWGVEAEAKLTLVDGLDVFANYTWQDTRKEGDILDKSSGMTEGLSELPENKVNAGIRYTFAGLTSELVMRYVDRRGVIVGDQTRPGGSDLVYLEDFATFDLSFSYRVIDRDNVSAKINFGIENLFDASYEETEGFPMPGRVLTGGMSVKF